MRKYFVFLLAIVFCLTAGCGKIDGPRFWWDDKTKEKLPDSYRLPADPSDTRTPEEMKEDGGTDPAAADSASPKASEGKKTSKKNAAKQEKVKKAEKTPSQEEKSPDAEGSSPDLLDPDAVAK